jgi:putative acetyltransferase
VSRVTARIRLAQALDLAAIVEICDRAFGQPGEGALVKTLWNRIPCFCLVAEHDEEVVGLAFFSPVRFGPPGAAGHQAVALGPMAVDPAHQNRGVGSALVRAGLEECRSRGELVVFVLGHARYYPRFGFGPAAPFGIDCEFEVPADVFLVQELEPGALRGRTGTVRYHPAFREL